KYKPYLVPFGIFAVKHLQKFNIVFTVMSFADQRDSFSGLQINPYQQGQCPKAFVFIIPADCTVMLIREKIWRRCSSRLYPGLFIIRKHMDRLFIFLPRNELAIFIKLHGKLFIY